MEETRGIKYVERGTELPFSLQARLSPSTSMWAPSQKLLLFILVIIWSPLFSQDPGEKIETSTGVSNEEILLQALVLHVMEGPEPKSEVDRVRRA